MTHNDKPNTIPWPPILLVGVAVAAIALDQLVPADELLWSVPEAGQTIGKVVAISAVAWDIWALLTLRNANTNILPHRAADQLVTDGPFAYSRNPIYVGNTVLLAGLAFALDNLWFLLAALDFAILVYVLAIKREESHLAAKFGETWQRYESRVPRWALGL